MLPNTIHLCIHFYKTILTAILTIEYYYYYMGGKILFHRLPII